MVPYLTDAQSINKDWGLTHYIHFTVPPANSRSAAKARSYVCATKCIEARIQRICFLWGWVGGDSPLSLQGAAGP